MARIIESNENSRRIIKLSSADVLAVVKEYQRLIYKSSSHEDIVNLLQNRVIYIPEDF